ncbi:glycosyltransferase family 2 protein [Lactiplantibacillus paraxiangfangensis]|uniref:glycosyltransferase n=1 Tax=Lactiplantibacillus paraxiangfangensis TaxID=3076224 RepID=UPI0030C7585E
MSLFNLIKIAISLCASEFFDIRQTFATPSAYLQPAPYQPLVSVVIPAFNEERCIIRTLKKVLANDYSNFEVIVVDDGSTDATSSLVEAYRQDVPSVKLVRQVNQGKSVAINHAVQKVAQGELVMVLDADSQLVANAITNMVAHFRDNRVLALAANVKMLPLRSWLGMAQRFEFLSAYRGKCGEDWWRNLYIIGGIGSTFRRNAMLSVGLYDTDTVTEDIDFTMKLIDRLGNQDYRIGYADDVVVYTEPVSRFKSLLRQRFRWKYGRFKAFLKYRHLFFSSQKRHSKMLGWYTLPNALLQEVLMLFEPFLFVYIQAILIYYGEWKTYGAMLLFFGLLISSALWQDRFESRWEKIKLLLQLPLAYFGLFLLTLVDFWGLLKSIKKTKALVKQTDKHANWEHVERQ